MTTGEKIKYYRKQRKISQEDLAALAGMSVSAIRKYETELLIPNARQLQKIANALYINPQKLRQTIRLNISEALSYLYAIGILGDIQFIKGENSSNFDEETMSIRFTNREMMLFLRDWAVEWQDKKEIYTKIKESAMSMPDEKTKAIILERAKEIEDEIGDYLKEEHLNDESYDFPVPVLSNKKKKELSKQFLPLERYSTILNVLNSLIHTSIQFKCYNIYSRHWNPHAIITFDADCFQKISVYDEECFEKFLFYFSEFKRLGKATTEYAFSEDEKTYYRYIINDRTLASGLKVIIEALNIPWETLSKKEKQLKEQEIQAAINMYDVPIEANIK